MNPAIYFTLLVFLLPLYLILTRKTSKNLPPGSFGFPIIGQSFSLLRAHHTNTAEQWFQEKIRKYGPISKLSLFGTPTAFLLDQTANKFIYTCDGNILANQQPPSIRRILGERNTMELRGDDFKRVRGALVSFLKPEVLKQYVGKMDEEVRKHLEMHWHGKQKVEIGFPFLDNIGFFFLHNNIGNAVDEDPNFQRFELPYIWNRARSKKRCTLELLEHMLDGMLSIPINLPFTHFGGSLQTRAKIRSMMIDLIGEKRAALKQQTTFHQDLITCLLSFQSEDSSIVLSDEEIVDNAITIMIAGYDTTSVLLTFLVKLLASDPSVYATIVQEQMEIAERKASGELLTWDDLVKMKYTRRVALETLRMTPPVLGSFRNVLNDFEFEGYTVPKGWQVVLGACMTHMDEHIFLDPSKFDPTRFEKQASVPPYSFVAFGGGPRMCPGYEFARIETLVTIHHLVTQFTWKLCCFDNSFSRNPMPVFKNGLPIQIEPKNSFSVN